MERLQQMLSLHPEYQEQLFIRGFIMTDTTLPSLSEFPFYNCFSDYCVGQYTIRVHKSQKVAISRYKEVAFMLLGNCVNPFSEVISEQEIIEKIAVFQTIDSEDALTYINELTGDFLIIEYNHGILRFLSDPAGMQFACYGLVNHSIFVSSHAQLVADVIPLTKSSYTQRLEKYRFFYKYGLFFPGDLTQYTELHRLLQNHITTFDGNGFSFKRFYPSEQLQPTQSEQEYSDLLHDVICILHNTMQCYAKKYRVPAISMTGGMDSKTTLACTNGLYDKFQYYSYVTMPGDVIDAEAAHKIAEQLAIPHHIHNVTREDQQFPNIEIARAVLEHNNGGYHVNDNDVRKREYFREFCRESSGFDVEVKSWVSEIARANYYKKFGLRKMPEHLTPKNMSSMYKVFLWQRRLYEQTNRVFRDFIEKTGFHSFPEGYDESDMYLWEFRYSAWGGIVITSEHSYSNEIVIPFNNRSLLDRMLQAPKEKRISDEFHEDIIRTANQSIADLGITVTNWNETKNRMRLERLYFLVNSHLP